MFGAPTTWTEVLGFVTGGLAVYYAARNKVATWPWSIANAFFFFLLFIDAQLYADAWLQVFYLVLSVVGLGVWMWGRRVAIQKPGYRDDHERRPALIKNASLPHLAAVAAFVGAFTVLFIPHLRGAGDPYPLLDALTTGMSIGAQYLLSIRRFQNWYIWIAVDCIYVPLYQAKGLTLTAIIYVVFMGLCFLGLRDWRQQRSEQPTKVDGTLSRGEYTTVSGSA